MRMQVASQRRMLRSVSDQFGVSNRESFNSRSLLNVPYIGAPECKTCVTLYLANYKPGTDITALAYKLIADLVTPYPLYTWAYPSKIPISTAVQFYIENINNYYPLS